MTVAEFIPKVSYKATGKVNSFTTGSTKWLKILAIANEIIDAWQEEYGVDWQSLYDPAFSIGSVTANDSYDLSLDEVRKLSADEDDVVRIMHTDGVGYTNYNIVPASKLKRYYSGQNKEYYSGFFCARIQDQLVFNHKFISTDKQYGGNIQVPVYLYADPLVNDSDDVPVDIPQWLVLMTAAEYIRNDVTKQAQYPNLISEANALMDRMRENNDTQIEEVSKYPVARGASW